MLTDSQVRAAKPKDKPYKLADSGGLYLHVTPAGGKHWRWRYEIEGREKLLTLGSYPEVKLPDARARRDAARLIKRDGRDPAVEKRIVRAADRIASLQTFEITARAWHTLRIPGWTPRHAKDVLTSLERDVFPSIGHFSIREITAPIVMEVLKTIENRGAIETAHRVRQRMSDVFVHAIAHGHGDNDPAAIVAPALKQVVRGRQPAITDLDAARAMISAVESQNAHPTTLLATRLLYLTAVRPSEVRLALWDEFQDLDGPEPIWVIPAERMKMRRDHIVPLAAPAVAVIQALQPLSGRWPHLFPNVRRPAVAMSENAMGYLLNRSGFHGRHVPHGFRALFSSVMNERFPSDRALIDLMLAHVNKDRVEGAYNRAEHRQRRRQLAEAWSDLIMDGQVDVNDLVKAQRRPSPRS